MELSVGLGMVSSGMGTYKEPPPTLDKVVSTILRAICTAPIYEISEYPRMAPSVMLFQSPIKSDFIYTLKRDPSYNLSEDG